MFSLVYRRAEPGAGAKSAASSAFAHVVQQKAEERRLRRAGEDEVLDDMETVRSCVCCACLFISCIELVSIM